MKKKSSTTIAKKRAIGNGNLNIVQLYLLSKQISFSDRLKLEDNKRGLMMKEDCYASLKELGKFYEYGFFEKHQNSIPNASYKLRRLSKFATENGLIKEGNKSSKQRMRKRKQKIMKMKDPTKLFVCIDSKTFLTANKLMRLHVLYTLLQKYSPYVKNGKHTLKSLKPRIEKIKQTIKKETK